MRPFKITRWASLGVAACLMLTLAQPTSAATEEQIEASIADGISWLAGIQYGNGSWYDHTAYTCFALIKLQDRAYELGFDSPFDIGYAYSTNVINGWQYVFSGGRTQPQSIGIQPHGNPDTTGNGYGVYFRYDLRHYNYTTGICLMALASSGDPSRPLEGGFVLPLGVDTYGELAQEAVDWLAFSQADFSYGEGGWYYYPDLYNADNSHTGYVVLGLAAAQNFGSTVPQFVKNELSIWIDYIQNDVTGGSGYQNPNSWVNVLKTGNLLFEMKFVGDDPATSPRFAQALDYIEEHWSDPGNCSGSSTSCQGWGFGANPAKYQAMFSLMKGFEFSNIDFIDLDGDSVAEHDWFAEFADVLVAQQYAGGYWSGCPWGNQVLCTTWALLTLEKISPVSDPFEIEVTKDYRYTAVCFEKDDDMDGSFGEDPVNFDALLAPIDDDGDGLFNEDAVDCDPTDTGYMLPISGMDPEAFTLEAVLKKNGNVVTYNPGQYYAVSGVLVTRLDPSVETFTVTIDEDFKDCTTPEKPLSVLNPRTGGGSVVVVEVIDGVAYQVYDAMSDVVSIEKNMVGMEIGATATFAYTFDEEQETAEFLVYVKFGPGLKGMTLPAYPDNMCMNLNSGLLEVFEEGEEEPWFTTDQAAEAWLTVIQK